MLTGSTFAFTGGTAERGFAAFWGRGAVTRFDGREGELTLDGEVASAMVGADFSRDAVIAGLMLSHSQGEGGYRSPNGSGEVSSTLTALFPYARYALSERVSVWGMAGYGEGTLTLTPEGQAPMRPDMDLAMGALGVRGVLLDGGTEGPTLAAKSDAFAVRTSTDAVTGLAASEAGVTRVRLALEGSQPFTLHGHDAHGRSLRCLAYRLRVRRVVLMPFDEGLHIDRRDQFHLVAELLGLPTPIVSARARFHRHRTARLRREEVEQLAPAQLLPERNRPVCVRPMQLKAVLRQIDPDDGNLLHGCLLPKVVRLRHHIGTSRCRREGASTPSLPHVRDRLRVRGYHRRVREVPRWDCAVRGAS